MFYNIQNYFKQQIYFQIYKNLTLLKKRMQRKPKHNIHLQLFINILIPNTTSNMLDRTAGHMAFVAGHMTLRT